MSKIVKFTIPINAREKYPIQSNCDNKLETNSWFDIVGKVIPTNIVIESPKTILRCIQIQVMPTDIQRSILKEWFVLYRYAYNCGITYVREHGLKTFMTLRPLVKATFSDEIKLQIKKCGIPVHTIDNAIKDVVLAYKTSLALHKGKKHFRIRYKKENCNQVITLEASAFSKLVDAFAVKKLGLMKVSSPIKGITRDSKLTMRDGKFTLFVPTDKAKKECTRTIQCCSLDPGMRTFQTVYCNDGTTYQIANNAGDKIKPLIASLDKDSKAKYKKRIRAKIKHIVDDLHWKTANTLCKLSDTIMIGNMSTIGIVRGNTLSKETKRFTVALSHYTFRMRLRAKCEEYGVTFMDVDESYTSKTCGQCGALNDKLGASKLFTCNCGFSIDRDINGARNIMIKHMK